MKNITFACLILLLSITTSCRKMDDESSDSDTETAKDCYLMDANINDALNQADLAANDNNLGKAGPTISIDTNVMPHTMVINYGTGTLCNDGKLRSGKLNITFTGRYRNAGTVITISTDSFYQNGNKLEAIKTITNNGRNTSGNLNYTISITNAKLTTLDNKTSTHSSTRNREWIAGETTITVTDDVYKITGNATGTNNKGLSYTADITAPLIIDFSCAYRITGGTLEIKPQNKLTRTVNYGTGTCDNSFEVKIGNKSYTIYKN